MINRKERRAAEHAARKAARKAGFPIPAPQTAPAETPEMARPATTETATTPEPADQTPEQAGIPPLSPTSQAHWAAHRAHDKAIEQAAAATTSQAQIDANRRNAQFSTGAKSPETRAISAQNHSSHGLARHENGTFRLLTTESAESFAAFKKALIDEHKPATETETILVNSMVESHWLTQRAQRLQDTCTSPDTGVVTDEKKFSLYMRYGTTHKRVFHKSLQDLTRLRANQRRTEIGFEAQRVKNEQHAMKKDTHYWDTLHKDALIRHQVSITTSQNIKARSENPTFQAAYDAELAARNPKSGKFEVA